MCIGNGPGFAVVDKSQSKVLRFPLRREKPVITNRYLVDTSCYCPAAGEQRGGRLNQIYRLHAVMLSGYTGVVALLEVHTSTAAHMAENTAACLNCHTYQGIQ